MALSLLAANNAQTVLAAGISSTATSLTVSTGTGTLFPSPVAGTSFFKLTIIDAATGTLTEIIHVTARNGDVFTIQRGQEGTVPRAWSANDIAANMMTAGTLSYILGNFQPLDPTLTALAALVGVANKLPYFNGDDTAALTDLTQVGRDIIGKTDIAAVLRYLGIVAASLTTPGLVRLTSSRVSGAEDIAATANAVAQNYTDIKALQGKTNDATPTNKGIIRVSDSRTSTESGIAASSLATSQNYADMKGLFGQCGMKSRNLGVVYTNSQTFAVFVSVNAVLSDGSSFLSANVSVDGNTANFRGSQTTNLAGQRATIAFMVPAGATYVVRQFSGTVSDVTWVEVDKK
ncbi:TPA: hypothetical protein ACQIYV_002694 [Escherichia coli]|nr:hypothetical protein [Escherichia coli]